MSKTTNPQAELVTVQVTPCQLAILNHFLSSKNASDFAAQLRSVCITAITSPLDDRENVACLMYFAEEVQKLAAEHFESFTNSTHK